MGVGHFSQLTLLYCIKTVEYLKYLIIIFIYDKLH